MAFQMPDVDIGGALSTAPAASAAGGLGGFFSGAGGLLSGAGSLLSPISAVAGVASMFGGGSDMSSASSSGQMSNDYSIHKGLSTEQILIIMGILVLCVILYKVL